MPIFSAGKAVALAVLAAGVLVLSVAPPASKASVPGRGDVQNAYDAAKATAAAGRHADDLHINDARCSALGNGQYTCEIDFVRTAEPEGRLYFTVVTLKSAPRGWTLIGGLCRSP